MRLTIFQRLAVWTTATTYLLILVGGLVRASGAGLGCPDWPRCFGSWIPPASAANLPPEFDPAQFNPTLMWTEYLNRLLGVSVGLLIVATAVSAWRHHRDRPAIVWTTIAAALLTGFQGWLGGRVVAHELAPWIVTVHMIVALVIVQMLLYVTVASTSTSTAHQAPSTSTKHLTTGITILVLLTLVQIALGTQVRGGVDDALTAGVARDAALGTVGRLDYFHRDAAFVVLVVAAAIAVWIVRFKPRPALFPWVYATVLLAVFQVLVGVFMGYVTLLPAAQVVHLTVASLLLGAETVLLLMSWRRNG